MNPTQRYFDRYAVSVDRLYAGHRTRTVLRRGPLRGRDLAVSVVARQSAPDVLDLGCGPGRVGEAVLDSGANTYVGVDLSPHMIALARRRLDRFATVELLQGDFLDLDLPRTFDVVLALGLFDYLQEPARAASWMRARCTSMLVASFTCRDWMKGPVRHFHYKLVHRCPIFDYTAAGASELLVDAGFTRVELASQNRRGFLVSAAP